MSEVRIAAEPRTEFGKGAARRTRRAGKVPAVLYGHGTDPRHIALPAHDFEQALKTDAGFNVLLELAIEGDTELALPKAIQREPLRGVIEHVDLILVRRGEKVTVEVPVHLTGDISSDGLLEQSLGTLSVTAEATHLPQQFEVDVEGWEVGATLYAKDVTLPAGAELDTDPEALVLHIVAAPTAAEMEAEVEEAEAELGAGATGAAEAEAAKQAVEGEAATEEPTGEGDIVPDTESGEGGPGEGQTPRA